MKITTAFGPPLRRSLRVILVAFSTLTVVLAAASVWVWRDGAIRQTDVSSMQERLEALESRKIALPDNLPSVEQLASLKQQVSSAREADGLATGSLITVLGELEARLPEAVRLARLHYESRDHRVELLAEADSAELLTQFLLELERSPRFVDVRLARQAQRDGTGGKAVQFEIRLKERL